MKSKPLLLALPLLLAGCRQDMHDQPRFRSYAETKLWPDGRSARPAVDGAIARGKLRTDAVLYRGKAGDQFVNAIPAAAMKDYATPRAFLARGQNRYNIYCSPCHGRLGDGEGVVANRGFKHPPSYHSDKLRNQPAGYYYDVITNGFGAMVSYASRIPVEDRWAIVSYVRALQLSQNATVEDVPAADRAKLDAPAAPKTEAPKETHH